MLCLKTAYNKKILVGRLLTAFGKTLASAPNFKRYISGIG